MNSYRRMLEFVKVWWIDGLFLICIVILGCVRVFASADFAANLPQDAADFSIPALTYLERGRMVVPAFGREFAMGHPVGMPILLVPVYLFTGHFIGNGIYLILLFAVGTMILVYFVGRELSGRLCGVVASLFLVSHDGFQQYSQKIMSEVPSMFLMMVVFAMTLYLAKAQRRRRVWLLLGVILGLMIVIRYDNVLVVGSLVAFGVARLLRVGRREAALLLLGAAPWFGIQAAYNYQHYGSFRRTGYEYEGNTGTAQCPMFSWRHVMTRTYMECRDIPPSYEDRCSGNLGLYGKTVLNEVDSTLPFSKDDRWKNKPQKKYRVLMIARSVLGVIGLIYCARWWRRKIQAAQLMLWVLSLGFSTVAFYTVYFWQEERFLLRLVPLFCLLNGAGVSALVGCFAGRSRWPRRMGVSVIMLATGALIGSLLFFSWKNLVLQSNDDLILYPEMRVTDTLIEGNAVVITNYDPLRTDVHLIRGTNRIAVQLGNDANYFYVPDAHGPPQPMSPLKAIDRPELIVQCLREGRPVYLLSKYFVPPQMLAEFQPLRKNLLFEPFAWIGSPGGEAQPYLFRMRTTGLPFLIE